MFILQSTTSIVRLACDHHWPSLQGPVDLDCLCKVEWWLPFSLRGHEDHRLAVGLQHSAPERDGWTLYRAHACAAGGGTAKRGCGATDRAKVRRAGPFTHESGWAADCGHVFLGVDKWAIGRSLLDNAG